MADNTYTFNREMHARDAAAPQFVYNPNSGQSWLGQRMGIPNLGAAISGPVATPTPTAPEGGAPVMANAVQSMIARGINRGKPAPEAPSSPETMTARQAATVNALVPSPRLPSYQDVGRERLAVMIQDAAAKEAAGLAPQMGAQDRAARTKAINVDALNRLQTLYGTNPLQAAMAGIYGQPQE